MYIVCNDCMTSGPVKFFSQDKMVVEDILAGSYLEVCEEQAATLGNVAVVLVVKSDNVCIALFPKAVHWLTLPWGQVGCECFTHVFVTDQG